MSDEQLRDDERAELLSWLDGPVPDGFADRVVEAWADEAADVDPGEGDAAAKVVPLWRRRSFRATVAAVVSIAAALLVAWLTRDAMIERAEARARAARLSAPDVDPPPALARLRVDAHVLLTEHCAPCHDSTATTAERNALDVFDVRADRWWLTMSDRQLNTVVDRMSTREGMTPEVIAGIATYVKAELDFRTGS